MHLPLPKVGENLRTYSPTRGAAGLGSMFSASGSGIYALRAVFAPRPPPFLGRLIDLLLHAHHRVDVDVAVRFRPQLPQATHHFDIGQLRRVFTAASKAANSSGNSLRPDLSSTAAPFSSCFGRRHFTPPRRAEDQAKRGGGPQTALQEPEGAARWPWWLRWLGG